MTLLVSLQLIFLSLYSSPVKSMNNFWIEISPQNVSSVAEYKFHITLEKKLGVFQWIRIVFPVGTYLIPPLPEEKDKRLERIREIQKSISIDNDAVCEKCFGVLVEKNEDDSFEIAFDYPRELNPFIPGYRETIISISKNAGIANPSLPDKYIYKIRTQQESRFINSKQIEIIDPCLKINYIVITIGSDKAILNEKDIILEKASIPLLKNGRTFVGIRFMGEIVFNNKAIISFDPKTQTVFFELGLKKIELYIGKPYVLVNGTKVNLDAPAFIQAGRTFVPLRFVSENLDASVDYDGKTQTITITYPKKM